MERVRCLAGGLVHNLRRRTFPAPLSAQRRGIEQPGSSPVTSRSLCLDLGQGFLFTGVRGRVILRSTHPGSRIERPLRAPGSPSEGLPTERQGPHVVVADEYAARRIVTALQNSPPGPSAFLCGPQRKGGARVHKKQAIRPSSKSQAFGGRQCYNRLRPRPSSPSRRTMASTSTFDSVGGRKRGPFLSRCLRDL